MATLATSTPSQMLRDYIVARVASVSPSLLTGWVFKFGKLPPEPDQVIAMIDQSGPVLFPHLLVENQGVQVLVRSKRGSDGYQTSYLMARAIRDLILGMPPHPPQFEELDGVTERSYIVPLGYDDQDRHTWSNNFQLLVEPLANVLTHRVSL